MDGTISVALCTHNGSRFIREQLRSILEQTVVPDEIVISDDNSTDDTVAVLVAVVNEWQAQHPDETVSVRTFHNSTALGVTANFEQALAACTGDLIALSDQDDVWHPERLERTILEFDRRPELLLLNSDARLVDRFGKPTGQTLLATLGVSEADQKAVHRGDGIDALLRRNIVTGATTMLRRGLIERARPFPQSWVHDEWLAIVAAATGKIDLLAVPLVDYRQHDGNQIGASSLDAVGKLGRLRAARTARNQRLLNRAQALQTRASGFTPPVSVDSLRKIDAKLAHEQMRSSLPGSRLRRIRPILKCWRSGGYSRYGLGLQDVLRDLVQPV